MTPFLFIAILWWLRTMKAALFWLYLWQLKEYHIGRFLAHFQTAKGKRLLFNPILFLKLFLLGAGAVFPIVFWLLVPVYGVEILLRRNVFPVFTLKMRLLAAAVVCLGVAALFSRNILFLLAVDILVPLVVSLVVLGMQPTAVFARSRILAKARAKRAAMKELQVVGITGSYGKTSTKEFLAHILGKKFHVLKTPEHVNSEVGIARTILRDLTDVHDIFVCEMGAYSKGGIALLAELAKPHIGMVTGVNEQHLATFGSIKNLLSAEGGEELAQALPKNGMLFVNKNSRLRGDYGKRKILEYGDATAVKIAKDAVSFTIEGKQFKVPTYGGHNVENIIGAILVAKELGMTIEEISEACKTIPADLSAIKVKQKNELAFINSTYSANPDGVLADLEYLKLWKGKKIIIMPCLIELGPASKEVHTSIGQKIAEVCDLAIITTGECIAAVKDGAGKDTPVLYSEDVQEIVGKVQEITKGKGAVLLEGGKESKVQRELLTTFKV